jgi:hypothetical protein
VHYRIVTTASVFLPFVKNDQVALKPR